MKSRGCSAFQLPSCVTVISGDRGCGKTTRLVELFLADPDGALIVPSYPMTIYIIRNWHLPVERVVAPVEAIERVRGVRSRLYVDEISLCESFPDWAIPLVVAVTAYRPYRWTRSPSHSSHNPVNSGGVSS